MTTMKDAGVARNPKPVGRGFTLIELVVAVAILGILVTIAYPAYQDQIRKSRRSEAQGALVELANLQQQFLADNPSVGFAATLDATGVSTTGLNGGAGYQATTPGGYYTLDVSATSAGPPASFTVRARPAGAQAADTHCAEMTLTDIGTKASKDSGGAATTDCWRK